MKKKSAQLVCVDFFVAYIEKAEYNNKINIIAFSEVVSMNENPELQGSENKKEKTNGESEALDWLQCIVSALVVCILLFTFVFRVIGVVGSSMVPTLENGDRLIVSKLFLEPKYGDIVVLRKREFKEEPIIKRVIATEGQTVDIDFDEGVVYVDNVALDEPYVNALVHEREDFTEPITVPEGCIFVMGDNRNRSTDSRYASIGCVDERLLIGKAYFRLFPFSKIGGLY